MTSDEEEGAADRRIRKWVVGPTLRFRYFLSWIIFPVVLGLSVVFLCAIVGAVRWSTFGMMVAVDVALYAAAWGLFTLWVLVIMPRVLKRLLPKDLLHENE